jgi:hypothetical protein
LKNAVTNQIADNTTTNNKSKMNALALLGTGICFSVCFLIAVTLRRMTINSGNFRVFVLIFLFVTFAVGGFLSLIEMIAPV